MTHHQYSLRTLQWQLKISRAYNQLLYCVRKQQKNWNVISRAKASTAQPRTIQHVAQITKFVNIVQLNFLPSKLQVSYFINLIRWTYFH